MIETGAFLKSAEDVGNVVVGVFGGRPVYLRDVAEIVDGAEEPANYVFFGDGAAISSAADEQPAVTLSVAKRPGANAISVTKQVLKKIDTLRGVIIPSDVEVSITRNYGETALEKSNELLWHMVLAIVGVSLLILLTLGWREAGIVALAIPSTLALTLLVFLLYGYTLNRITLFALIFSIGILVDDAIVVVENIVRHFHLPQKQGPQLVGDCGRSGERSRQPDHPRHVRGDCGGVADGVCGRADGALHAADPDRIERGDVFFAWRSPSSSRRGHRSASALGQKYPRYRGRAMRQQSHLAHKEDFFTRIYRRVMGPMIAHPKLALDLSRLRLACCCCPRWHWSASAG